MHYDKSSKENGGQSAEAVRRVLRKLIPNQSLYGRGSRILSQLQTIRHEGWHTYRKLYRPAHKENPISSVRLKESPYPIFFRPRTQDVVAIVQNIIRHEYGQLPASFTPKWVIDGGSYIGDVAIHYLTRFQNCRALAIEPNAANYVLAQKNLAPFGERVVLYPYGLWSRRTRLHLSGEFMDAALSDLPGENQTECLDIASLMELHSIRQIDVVKLDVEWAEREIISTNSETWLSRTRVLIVEFHSPEIERDCLEFLGARGWHGFSYRQLHYLFNPGAQDQKE